MRASAAATPLATALAAAVAAGACSSPAEDARADADPFAGLRFDGPAHPPADAAAEAGAPDAAVPDGAGAGVCGPAVCCGAALCAPPEVCCASIPGGGTPPSAACTAAEDCDAIAAECDGPEDCGRSRCCADFQVDLDDNAVRGELARCRDACDYELVLASGLVRAEVCHSPATCPAAQPFCCRLSLLGASGVCLQTDLSDLVTGLRCDSR